MNLKGFRDCRIKEWIKYCGNTGRKGYSHLQKLRSFTEEVNSSIGHEDDLDITGWKRKTFLEDIQADTKI